MTLFDVPPRYPCPKCGVECASPGLCFDCHHEALHAPRPQPPADVPAGRRFDGATYEPERDCERLTGQWRRVAAVMADGEWHTLAGLQRRIGRGTEAAISARIRDFRKEKYGAHEVVREHLGGGLWRYRVVSSARLRGQL